MPILSDAEIAQHARRMWNAKPEKDRLKFDQTMWEGAFVTGWKVLVEEFNASIDREV